MSASFKNQMPSNGGADLAPIMKLLKALASDAPLNEPAALLTHGRQFEPVERPPEGLSKGPPGRCYANCTSALMHYVGDPNPPFFYAEGYAMDCDLGVPLEHAWLVDVAGKAIDLTWRDRPGVVYFGVTFKLAFLLETMQQTEVYGVLFNTRIHGRLLSSHEAFASALCRPVLPGLPGGTVR
jgi:hypothetical protein